MSFLFQENNYNNLIKSNMKRIILAFILLLTFNCKLFSQSLDDLTFGTDSTLEVMTWNIEWFPKKQQTTVDYVKTIIENLKVDVIAIQEIDDRAAFQQMLDDLVGWDGYCVNGQYQGLGYVYNTNTVNISRIYEICTSNSHELPRSPLVMEMTFNGQNFVIINNHLKCCGNGYLNTNDPEDEENRRLMGCNLLDMYISTNFPDDNVIVLGDMNDEITDETANNVFKTFINKPDEYRFIDMGIAEGSTANWSYPSWPSHLDHILVSNELFDEFEDENAVTTTIKIGYHLSGGFYQYDKYISDHRPVALKIKVKPNVSTQTLQETKFEIKAYPNPFKETVRFEFLEIKEETIIEIYNSIGKYVTSFSLEKGQNSKIWNTENLNSGFYFIKYIDKHGKKIGGEVLIKN